MTTQTAPTSLAPARHLARRTTATLVAAALLAPTASLPLYAQELPMPASRSNAPVTLNFVNAEIELVTRAIGTMLGRELLVDPRVRGQITITSDKAVPPQVAWRNYLSALRGSGFTVVENNGLLKVVPETEARYQTGTVVTGAPQARGDIVVTQIFRLTHENPNNLVPILRPLISANSMINANAASNTLVITDYADNLQRLGKIIAAMDQPSASDVEVLPLQHQLAADLAPLVQKLAEGGSGGVVPGAAPGRATSTSILVEPRSNALIVRAANAARLAEIKSLVAKLDRPVQGGGPAGNIWVVYLRNANAVQLAEVLRATLASGMAGSGAASGSLGSSGTAARPTPAPRQPAATATSAGGGESAAAATPVAASEGPSTGGQIQADPSNNALIISAPEPVYRQLRKVIDQLDTRRAQIYVESMIVKVDAEKAAEFGIQWQGLLANDANTRGVVGGTNFGSTGNIIDLSLSGSAGTAPTSGSLGAGLNIGFINKIQGIYTLGALARFLETNTAGNVLSTPNLVALDNEEAKIVVGQNVPFVTGSFTNTGATGGATNPFQTIERKDVGLTLRVKSQVGESGTVRMTIYQENSSVSGNAGASGLITDKSSIETQVVVNDGQMIVLGGLMKDEFTDSDGRVPGLASIPILGNLFRNDARKRIKSNLLVFLRPVVLRDQNTSDRLTLDRYDAIRAMQQTGAQPEPHVLSTIQDAPVLPPAPVRERPVAPPDAPPLQLVPVVPVKPAEPPASSASAPNGGE